MTEEKSDNEIVKKHELSSISPSKTISNFHEELPSDIDSTKSYESQSNMMRPMAHRSHIFTTNNGPSRNITMEKMNSTAIPKAEYNEAELHLS